MSQQNTISFRATGIIAISGLSAIAIMAAFDKATSFVNSLPRATVDRLADTLPLMTLALCGFTFAGGVLVAWAFTVARMRPTSASTSSANIGQQQPPTQQIEIRKPLQLQLPPAQTSAPSFAAWRGDIAASAQKEAAQTTNTPNVNSNDLGNDYASTPEEMIGFKAVMNDYDDCVTNVTNPQTYAQNTPNERISVRLSDGKTVTIARAAWLAFASLDRVNRDQWRQQLRAMSASAPNEDFTTCRQIATAYNLLNGQSGWISTDLRNRVTGWITE